MIDRRALIAALPALALPGAASGQTDWAVKLVAAARGQIGRTVLYDPAYVRLAYPGGDVPADRGVCTDVVIRAYRAAFGLDLQKLVHEDMSRAFSAWTTRRAASIVATSSSTPRSLMRWSKCHSASSAPL